MKLCECGCGNPSPIAKKTSKHFGHIKGKPTRFIKGHYWRTMTGDRNVNWRGGVSNVKKRNRTYIPNHPKAISGYVHSYILIAEKALGKNLPNKAVIHHYGDDCLNDEKIVICENQSYHNLLHLREKALKECGNPNFRRCVFCKIYDNTENIYIYPNNNYGYHRKCSNEYMRSRRRKGFLRMKD